jgi:hypothetical protein
MLYRQMTFRHLLNTWMLIKELRGTGKGEDVIARLAVQINKERKTNNRDYTFFVKNLRFAKVVLEEEAIGVRNNRADGIKEWMKKRVYLSILKNAIKLSEELADKLSVPVFPRF